MKLFKRFSRHRNSLTAETLANSVVEVVLEILNNLEYLLHQIDNAQLFADMEG